VVVSLELSESGWCRVTDSRVGMDVQVRFGRSDRGALVVTEVRVVDPTGVRGPALRNIPLGRIEQLANLPVNRARIGSRSPADRPIGARLAEIRGAVDDMPGDVVESLGAGLLGVPRGRSLKLRPPGGRRYPDSFYKRVADVYAYAAATRSAPAIEIAKASDVKPTTVHRWVREARSRGFLPHEGVPGKRGV
jgi:hypothetical protein